MAERANGVGAGNGANGHHIHYPTTLSPPTSPTHEPQHRSHSSLARHQGQQPSRISTQSIANLVVGPRAQTDVSHRRVFVNVPRALHTSTTLFPPLPGGEPQPSTASRLSHSLSRLSRNSLRRNSQHPTVQPGVAVNSLIPDAKPVYDSKAPLSPKSPTSMHSVAVTSTSLPAVDNVSKSRNLGTSLSLAKLNTVIHHSSPRTGAPPSTWADNKVRTYKYTPLTFLPKNLWWQFHRLANVYFVIMCVSQFFAIFEVASPVGQLFGIVLVLGISAIKEGIEDYRRHMNDAEVNGKVAWLFGGVGGSLTGPTSWVNVNFGDTVQPTSLLTRLSGPDLSSAPSTAPQYARVHPRSASLEARPVSAAVSDLDDQGDRTMPPSFKSTDTRNPFIASTAVSPITPPTAPSPNPDCEPGAGKSAPIFCFHATPWHTLRPGDLVLLRSDDAIPADIVPLASSERGGVCRMETKNLDGETNLKARWVPRWKEVDPEEEVAHVEDAVRELQEAWIAIDAEAPSAVLSKFQGRLTYIPPSTARSAVPPTPTHPSGHWPGRRASRSLPSPIAAPLASHEPPVIVPLDATHLLLRGAVVKNTGWVVGCVVYGGHDTRVVRNGGIVKGKQSRVERVMNVMVTLNFVLMILMAIATTARYTDLFTGYTKENPAPPFARGNHDNNLAGFFITFWTSMIVIQTIIPISLYTTIEITRAFQVYFIAEDDDMRDPERTDDNGEMQGARPRNWNVMDDMGQVEVLLSDKTGTLTQNKMEFRSCSVDGVLLHADDPNLAGTVSRTLSRRSRAKPKAEPAELAPVEVAELPHVEAPSGAQSRAGSGSSTRGARPDPSTLTHFLTGLAVCHTVPTPHPPHYTIQAESPDEKALVEFGRRCGFEFVSRSSDGRFVTMRVDQGSSKREDVWEVLHTCEFSSDRRMMSVVVRKKGEEGVVVYSKGADSTILPLSTSSSSSLIATTQGDLTNFAELGLRTLCIAYRNLTQDEYARWRVNLDEALGTLDGRDEAVQDVYGEIEGDFNLVGATAIEDRLQDQVPETIRDLQRAGIKVWVLTGDKVETAVNIGYSCQLLNSRMALHTITNPLPGTNVTRMLHEINKSLKTPLPKRLPPKQAELISRYPSLKSVVIAMGAPSRRTSTLEAGTTSYGLVMDGDAVAMALETDRGKQELLDLVTRCEGVMFCRMSPRQKWEICTIVRQGMDVVVAAVGDGANDVGMIEEANIGVGITGSEGVQAAASSDYSISQFRFLANLFFVHGRWSYVRLCLMVSNIFYKNLAWASMNYMYQYWAANTATFATDYLYVLLFNVVFTSATVVTMGVLEQDISKETALSHPELYLEARVNHPFNLLSFFGFILDAFYQGFVAFYMAYGYALDGNFLSGIGVDRISLGVILAINVVATVNMSTLIQQQYWTFLTIFLHVGSTVLIFLVTIVLSSLRISLTELEGVARFVLLEPALYFEVLVTAILGALPRFAWVVWKRAQGRY
ncbi:phospholipid-translocating P-type ATPase [Gonapodya prolifera JEL478]|uniref:Phospholipid-transporting ATPase n=1 Tax=Gonapodya prolifera (strain JEL478) TaxID=1344416 RepID=A0A139A420_GONPJ|nr:phospholipid-translocating P-type ATPase [Gonapodya prolifera JEL478]|eukprot:KXS11552.1 phospholipid-translocating P-type ATPase [Gonapodya prolifera JEL478]